MELDEHKFSIFKEKIFATLILFGFWLLLTANFSPLNLALGLIISGLTIRKFGDRFLHFRESTPLAGYLYRLVLLFLFLFVFLKEALLSAWQVMKLALAIKPDLKGGIVRIQGKVKQVTALTIVANLITLTPGTMTVDLDVDKDVYYIHWIKMETDDRSRFYELIVSPFESWIAKILNIEYLKGS